MAPRWWVVSLQLCLFGFIKELRISEPFITPYLLSPYQNLTSDQVNHEVYPVSIYSSLPLLLLVFLVTDFLRYKAVIVLEGIAYVITYCLLIWGKGVPTMQVVEFFYAMASSTEVAYYTYIYAKVDPKYYQRVTSHTYGAILVGKFLAGATSQVVVSTGLLNYWSLNIGTLTFEILALIVALTLPRVEHSIYFHRAEDPDAGVSSPQQLTCGQNAKKAYMYLWDDFRAAFSDKYVVKWSIWWAVAACGCMQVVTYIQLLWDEVGNAQEDTQKYNGAVEAVHTLLSAFATFLIGAVSVKWEVYGNVVLAMLSLVEGVLLTCAGLIRNLWVTYINYVLFRMIYQMMLTVASAEVARKIRPDSHGLVFGINTFLSLAASTILTAIAAGESGLALAASWQFVVYGGLYLVLGAVFLIIAIVVCCQGSENSEESQPTLNHTKEEKNDLEHI